MPHPSSFRWFTVGLAATITATSCLSTAHAAARDWTETPTGQSSGILYAVDADAGSLWTVGTSLVGPDQNFHTLALRRNGKTWVSTPQPVQRGRLHDLAVSGRDDVWAVGEQSIAVDGTGSKPWPFAEHWNGRRWSVVETPPDPAADHGALTAVAATRQGEIWVSGWSYSDGTGGQAYVYRRDKHGWHSVTDDLAKRFGYIWDLLPIDSNDVWAGFNGLAHYDGRRWTRADLPGDDSKVQVISIAATGAKDVWAAGLREDPVLWKRPVVLHYDGTGWTEVATPADSALLNSIELIDGEPVAVGETSAGEMYVLRRAADGALGSASTPPQAGTLFGSTVAGGRLWVAGTAYNPDGSVDPYLANGSTR